MKAKIYCEVIILQRRTFIKLSAFATGAAGLGLGITGCESEEPVTSFPKSSDLLEQSVEAIVNADTGQVQVNPDIMIRHSVCMGCYSSCGTRVRIDKKSGVANKVMGNPYHPKNAEPALPFETTLDESYQAFSLYNDKGYTNRATVCARGNSAIEYPYDPLRITTPLKRAGKRGEGKWQPISWEQLIEETVEGGQLFKDLGDDTNIEGLRQIYDPKNPLDPNAPELGPKSNGLTWMSGGSYGRINFAQRFVLNSFGSNNFYGHTGT
jgi:tetrathionate reductase subunit A